MHVVLDLVDRLYEWTQRAIEEHTSGGGTEETDLESTSLPQPRQWQSPQYSEAPHRVTPKKTFRCAEQQSLSRWVMGSYNAAPAQDLALEELATLGVKLGTVRSRIHRGRQALRDYLAAHSEHGERVAHAKSA